LGDKIKEEEVIGTYSLGGDLTGCLKGKEYLGDICAI
jgi:hypothetical protein